jgi:hypothetical protein
MSRAVLAQLYALRAQIAAVIELVETEQAVPAPDAPAACDHPQEMRKDESTLTQRQFFCRACQQLVAQ